MECTTPIPSSKEVTERLRADCHEISCTADVDRADQSTNVLGRRIGVTLQYSVVVCLEYSSPLFCLVSKALNMKAEVQWLFSSLLHRIKPRYRSTCHVSVYVMHRDEPNRADLTMAGKSHSDHAQDNVTQTIFF